MTRLCQDFFASVSNNPFYLVWVSATLANYSLLALISKMNNDSEGKWFWVLVVCGMGGMFIWAYVSKHSRALVFDALLFDVCMIVSQYATLAVVGAAAEFTALQWFGAALVVAGMLLVKS